MTKLTVDAKLTDDKFIEWYKLEHPQPKKEFSLTRDAKIAISLIAFVICFVALLVFAYSVIHPQQQPQATFNVDTPQTIQFNDYTITFQPVAWNLLTMFIILIGFGLCVGWIFHGVGFVLIKR